MWAKLFINAFPGPAQQLEHSEHSIRANTCMNE